uniref:RING-type domain-containing protein n=1 Tax=Wuchereria bancrofti TaxID=6293 RepID=A0A1I8EF82_WUCBA
MTSRLQCLICLDTLLLSESAAVRCGHVFHLQCILQWFENCKTCPVCRKKATTRDLVRQLFFQMEENKSFIFNSTDPFEMHNQLQNALDNLEKEKQAVAEAKNEANAYITANLLLKEKVTNLESISQLNMQRIKHLEDMLTKQMDLEKELQKYKKRLRATAFYKLLSSVKDEPVLEIDKYISSEGLEVKKFIALLRSHEVCHYRGKSRIQNLNEHKNLNVALKKELDSARVDPSQTIMNAALEEVIAFSPRQQSFSPVKVDDRKFPASLIASAYRSTSTNSAAVEKMQGTTPVRRSLVEKVSKNESQSDIENDMEEVFVPPIIRRCAITLSHSTLRKTRTVKSNQMTKNRVLKRRSSCIQHRKEKEARSLRYLNLKNDIITID